MLADCTAKPEQEWPAGHGSGQAAGLLSSYVNLWTEKHKENKKDFKRFVFNFWRSMSFFFVVVPNFDFQRIRAGEFLSFHWLGQYSGGNIIRDLFWIILQLSTEIRWLSSLTMTMLGWLSYFLVEVKSTFLELVRSLYSGWPYTVRTGRIFNRFKCWPVPTMYMLRSLCTATEANVVKFIP